MESIWINAETRNLGLPATSFAIGIGGCSTGTRSASRAGSHRGCSQGVPGPTVGCRALRGAFCDCFVIPEPSEILHATHRGRIVQRAGTTLRLPICLRSIANHGSANPSLEELCSELRSWRSTAEIATALVELEPFLDVTELQTWRERLERSAQPEVVRIARDGLRRVWSLSASGDRLAQAPPADRR